jgi:Nineteen complex-related protein 2
VIRALKERRRERARGEDYMSLDDNGEELKPKRRDSDDDEELYREFVDEPVRLQKNMEAAQQKHKKEQIKEALHYSDSEAMSDVDENEWEIQQIAKVQPGLTKLPKRDPNAMPSEIPPVTPFATSFARLKGKLEEMKARRSQLLEQIEQLDKESEEIGASEERVQEKLTEAGREYEKLRDTSGANRGLDEVGEFGVNLKT